MLRFKDKNNISSEVWSNQIIFLQVNQMPSTNSLKGKNKPQGAVTESKSPSSDYSAHVNININNMKCILSI